MSTSSTGRVATRRAHRILVAFILALATIWLAPLGTPGDDAIAGGRRDHKARKKDKDKDKDDRHDRDRDDDDDDDRDDDDDDRRGPKDKSDLDKDGDVDLDDLDLFSRRKLEQDWQDVDWPSWIDTNARWEKHYARLFTFIREYFSLSAGGDPLRVIDELTRPARLAPLGSDRWVVSDPGVGAVFILSADLTPSGEIGGFEHPLGVAVNTAGEIYVGEDGRDRIEVYSATDGGLVRTIGETLVRKPVDLDFDDDGNLYVADAESAVVWVFGPGGSHAGTFRKGLLQEPIAVEAATRTTSSGATVTEVYVLDKADYFVKVFDTSGKFLRYFGGFPSSSGWWNVTWDWEGKFVAPQSVFLAADGYLHVLDTYLLRVQILDPVSGAYISDYGSDGTGPGDFRLPLDAEQSWDGKVFVSDADLSRVEVIR